MNHSFLSDEGPMLETLDYTIRIGITPTFFYFDFSTLLLRYESHALWTNQNPSTSYPLSCKFSLPELPGVYSGCTQANYRLLYLVTCRCKSNTTSQQRFNVG